MGLKHKAWRQTPYTALSGASSQKRKTKSDDNPLNLSAGIQSGKVADEALQAMTALGFVQSAAQKVVTSILKEQPDMSVEAVIREALKRI